MNNAKLFSAYRAAHTIAETMTESIRHVSVIMTPQGQILGSGQNFRKKTHPFNQKNGYAYNALHSEVAAWLSVRWYDYNRLILINFRFNNYLELRFSKPCKYCSNFVQETFERTYYSLNSTAAINEETIDKLFRRFYYE